MEPPGTSSKGPPPRVDPPVESAAPRQIHERYELRGTLGRGGMATVYEVSEAATGRKLALKRLRTLRDSVKHQRNSELFAREFHALSQLAHPRIVQAYDYGVDEHGQYYTMELLDGGDLQQLAPLPWRTACAIARDLCSALSLLHSRRLVHRDLSPRNVRRTAGDLAKLFDFGALAPMGPQKVLVGTPPCCAPETISMQPLDGRTDLFALGATLYYMLVGRHAYVARHFAQLHYAWQAGYTPPSHWVPDIPPALDLLVSDLLRLEPATRPANAAEVIQRLCAIDGGSLDEELQVAAAYLSLPTLIGRDAQVRRVQRRLGKTSNTRGACIVVQGAPGVGRSRFVDHCLLEATLLGTSVVRCDADDARSGDYGAVRALAQQLLHVLPVAARQAAEPWRAELSQLAGEQFKTSHVFGPVPGFTRPQLQAAVHEWLRALSKLSRLLIAVDDFDRIDEPSAALLSLTVHDLPPGLSLLVSLPTLPAQAASATCQLMLEHGSVVGLRPLSSDESESLLKALFGDVPNVGPLADRLHELAVGKPRDLLELAQNLVNQGQARYEAGAWSLPVRIDGAGLPSSMAQALRARIEALPAGARKLGSALALCPDLSFSLDECAQLCEQTDRTALLTELAQLIEAQIVFGFEEQYRLARPLWAAPLCATLDRDAEHRLQAHLAQVMQARGLDFRASQHWMRAGQEARALDVLVAHAAASQEDTAQNAEVFIRYARSLPEDWYDTYRRGLELCASMQRPRRDAMILRGRLAGLAPAFALGETAELNLLDKQLCEDSGLVDWEALDPSLPPMQRIQLAQQAARARYDASPEHERVYDPERALKLLTRSVGSSGTRVANGLDIAHLHALPKLEPFALLSPSIAAMRDLVAGLEARYTGRPERARLIYLDLLERIERPDHAGLEGSYAQTMGLGIMTALALMEACRGQASALTWVERVMQQPAYRANAEHARMVHHLFQGDIQSATRCREQVERLRLQNQQLYIGTHVVWEIDAHVLAEDLTHVRYVAEHSGRLARTYHAWEAVHDYACAEYQRIRRDFAGALAQIERALERVEPGMHVLWASMVNTRVRALSDLGRTDDALTAAEGYVALAQQLELRSVAEPLRLSLALCQARAGRDEAQKTAQAVLSRHQEEQVGGLCLGFAHEMCARVALWRKDQDGFRAHLEQCREQYCRHGNPALLVKYERLVREGEGKPQIEPSDLTNMEVGASDAGMRLAIAFEHCANDDQRGRLALTTLVRQCGASGGVLYRLARGKPEFAAGSELSPRSEMADWVQAYLDSHVHDATTATESTTDHVDDVYEHVDAAGQNYRLVLLSHNAAGALSVMAVAVLALTAPEQFRYPGQIASMMSRLWAEQADIETVALPRPRLRA